MPHPHVASPGVSQVLVSPQGHRIERILVVKTLNGPAREMLRVKHGTYFVADCRIVAEVAELVDAGTRAKGRAVMPLWRRWRAARHVRRAKAEHQARLMHWTDPNLSGKRPGW